MCPEAFVKFILLAFVGENEIANTKNALEGPDTEPIKQATEKLTQAFYAISEKLYKQKMMSL